MTPGILKEGLHDRTRATAPAQPHPSLWTIVASLLLVALIGWLAYMVTLPTDANAAMRGVAYQALLLERGDNPLLAVQSNVPFGHVFAQTITPIAAFFVHGAYEGFGTSGLRVLAAIGSAIMAAGVVTMVWSLAPTPHRRGALQAVAAAGCACVLLLVLARHGANLPALWGLAAAALGACAAALSCAFRPNTTGKAVGGVLAGIALLLAPSTLPLAALVAFALGANRRPSTRQAVVMGLGVGGVIALMGGEQHGALTLWAFGVLTIAAGLLGPRAHRRALYLVPGALVLVGTIVALPRHEGLFFAGWGGADGGFGATLALVLGSIALTGVLFAALVERQRGWRRLATEPRLLALGAVGPLVALCAAWGHAEGALLLAAVGFALASFTGFGRAVLACTGVVGIGALAHAVITQPPPHGRMDTATPYEGCGDTDITGIMGDLAQMQARRVLADPMVGWQLVMAGSRAGMVSAGLHEEGAGQEPDPARDALNDTSPTANGARSISTRHSVDAVVVCGANASSNSLSARMWAGDSQSLAGLSGWLEPVYEREGYVVHRVLR